MTVGVENVQITFTDCIIWVSLAEPILNLLGSWEWILLSPCSVWGDQLRLRGNLVEERLGKKPEVKEDGLGKWGDREVTPKYEMWEWLERVHKFSRCLSLGCVQGGKGNQGSSASSYCFCLSLRSSRLEGTGGSQKPAFSLYFQHSQDCGWRNNSRKVATLSNLLFCFGLKLISAPFTAVVYSGKAKQ